MKRDLEKRPRKEMYVHERSTVKETSVYEKRPRKET